MQYFFIIYVFMQNHKLLKEPFAIVLSLLYWCLNIFNTANFYYFVYGS